MPNGQTSQLLLPPVSNSSQDSSSKVVVNAADDSSDYVNVSKTNGFSPFKLHKGKSLIDNLKYRIQFKLLITLS